MRKFILMCKFIYLFCLGIYTMSILFLIPELYSSNKLMYSIIIDIIGIIIAIKTISKKDINNFRYF